MPGPANASAARPEPPPASPIPPSSRSMTFLNGVAGTPLSWSSSKARACRAGSPGASVPGGGTERRPRHLSGPRGRSCPRGPPSRPQARERDGHPRGLGPHPRLRWRRASPPPPRPLPRAGGYWALSAPCPPSRCAICFSITVPIFLPRYAPLPGAERPVPLRGEFGPGDPQPDLQPPPDAAPADRFRRSGGAFRSGGRLLQKDPLLRPRSAREVAERLEVLAVGGPRRQRRRRHLGRRPCGPLGDSRAGVATAFDELLRGPAEVAERPPDHAAGLPGIPSAALAASAAGSCRVRRGNGKCQRLPSPYPLGGPTAGGRDGGGESSDILASSLRAALLRSLLLFQNLSTLPPEQVDEVPGSLVRIARALAADELVTSRIDCRGEVCQISLAGLRERTGGCSGLRASVPRPTGPIPWPRRWPRDTLLKATLGIPCARAHSRSRSSRRLYGVPAPAAGLRIQGGPASLSGRVVDPSRSHSRELAAVPGSLRL